MVPASARLEFVCTEQASAQSDPPRNLVLEFIDSECMLPLGAVDYIMVFSELVTDSDRREMFAGLAILYEMVRGSVESIRDVAGDPIAIPGVMVMWMTVQVSYLF